MDKPLKVKTGDPFSGLGKDKKPSAVRYFALRLLRGPKAVAAKHQGYLVVKAFSGGDAKRQWFNHYGYSQRSHAFDLQAVELDRNHPSCKEAITAPHPAGQGLSMQQMMDQDFSAVQEEITKGPRAPLKAVVDEVVKT